MNLVSLRRMKSFDSRTKKFPNGSSDEFSMIRNNQVIRTILSIAYKKWTENRMSDQEFAKNLRNIWNIEGVHGEWYGYLAGIEVDLDLIHGGIFKREDCIEDICTKIKKLIG